MRRIKQIIKMLLYILLDAFLEKVEYDLRFYHQKFRKFITLVLLLYFYTGSIS